MSSFKNVTRTAELMKEMNCYESYYFDDRVLIQKKIFLACRCGITNDFDFIWGVRGVYSKELNKISSMIISHNPKYLRIYRLTEKEIQIAAYINSLTAEIQKRDLDITDLAWYELLADIAYMDDQKYDKEQIIQKLKEDDQERSMKEIKQAYKLYSKGQLRDF